MKREDSVASHLSGNGNDFEQFLCAEDRCISMANEAAIDFEIPKLQIDNSIISAS